MTLCDTGPLVALVDADDFHHKQCVQALATLPAVPFITTWPCLTEAMHLLGRVGGQPAQDELWGLLADGLIQLHLPTALEWERLRDLMRQYADAPMDLADSSLVAAADVLGVTSIFTLDSHFRIYQIGGKTPFQVVP